jgi:hypothetical protein
VGCLCTFLRSKPFNLSYERAFGAYAANQEIFWYFWLAIQNTANRHVSNSLGLQAVFISFSLARCCCCGSCVFLLLLLLCASTPPRPPFRAREVLKIRKENRL